MQVKATAWSTCLSLLPILYKRFFISIYHRNITILLLTVGATKLSIHTAEQIELSEFAKVLAHPARISILQYISRQENCICGDIVDEIGLSQPTISQHLQVIRKAGLLKGTFEGKSICYCLNMEKFKEFQENIQSFFTNTAAQCC